MGIGTNSSLCVGIDSRPRGSPTRDTTFDLDLECGTEAACTNWQSQHHQRVTRDNNALHTEPRAARLLETMIFAAAR